MNQAVTRAQGATTRVQGATTRVTERLPTIQENKRGIEIIINSKINYTEVLSHTTLMNKKRNSTINKSTPSKYIKGMNKATAAIGAKLPAHTVENCELLLILQMRIIMNKQLLPLERNRTWQRQ